MSFFLCRIQKMRASLAREMLGHLRGKMGFFERRDVNASEKLGVKIRAGSRFETRDERFARGSSRMEKPR